MDGDSIGSKESISMTGRGYYNLEIRYKSKNKVLLSGNNINKMTMKIKQEI